MMGIASVIALLGFCSTCASDPQLPDVDAVLTKATSKAHVFAEQAAAMQREMAERQVQSRDSLAAQRKKYEQQLYAVGNQTKDIRHNNTELDSGNRKLDRANSEMLARLQGLRRRNGRMRSMLQKLTDKVVMAHRFLEDSMQVTDDSQAVELEVLAPTTPRPTLDNFLAATMGEQVSLLGVGAIHGDPESLVNTLSDSIAEIAAAEEAGAAELKAQFLDSLSESQKLQARANATRDMLLQRRRSLHEFRANLLTAEEHLNTTSGQLRKRLNSMMAFASSINASATSQLKDEAQRGKAIVAKAAVNASVATKASVMNLGNANATASSTLNVTRGNVSATARSAATRGRTSASASSDLKRGKVNATAHATKTVASKTLRGADAGPKVASKLKSWFGKLR